MYQPYPGAAQMPQGSMPPAPATVRNAANAMYTGAVASLFYIVASVVSVSADKHALVKFLPKASGNHAVAARMGTPLLIGAIAGGLIAAVLWVVIAQACQKGRNWARATGTALFAIATVDAAAALAVPFAALVKVAMTLVWLAGLVAVALLWQGPSSAFFRAGQP